MNRIENWYQSAELAEMIEGELTFEVTNEQKVWMESHMTEVDEKFENKFGVVPHTIYFEPFWNGEEDCFTCTALFDLDER